MRIRPFLISGLFAQAFIMIADAETAASKDVELISPPMGKEKEGTLGLGDFHIEKSGKVVSCPQGHSPIHVKRKKTRYCAAFNLANCDSCPNKAICPASPGKKAFYLRFTDKQLRISLRRSAVDTQAFKNRYRWRAGVEATMSEYDRRTGAKRLRVRGLKAVRYSAVLKALGLNLLRAAAVMAAVIAGIPMKTGTKGGRRPDIAVFKERFWAALAYFIRALERIPFYMNIYPKLYF